MLFRIIRKMACGSLLIEITFALSEDPPCELMTEHADEVESAVIELYDQTEKSAAIVAMEIVDKFRRVSSVRVEDRDTDECIVCLHEED